MQESARHGFLEGRLRAERHAQEAGLPRHVLVVLLEEDPKEPSRWNQTDEAAALVDDRKAARAVLDGLPRRELLIDTRSDRGRIVVHELPCGEVGGDCKQLLDRKEAQ